MHPPGDHRLIEFDLAPICTEEQTARVAEIIRHELAEGVEIQMEGPGYSSWLIEQSGAKCLLKYSSQMGAWIECEPGSKQLLDRIKILLNKTLGRNYYDVSN
jgi:hypothetical protein